MNHRTGKECKKTNCVKIEYSTKKKPEKGAD
jgi:hypothetical protein